MHYSWLLLTPLLPSLSSSEQSCPIRFITTTCTESFPGRFWNSSKDDATGSLRYQRHPILNLHIPEPPLDVRSLRPSDVQFLGSMGDSVTAGLFVTVKEKLGWYLRKQGVKNSFVTGWTAPVSLVRLFNQYSPDIVGGSRGATAFMSVNRGEKSRIMMDLNVAVSGTTASSISKQVQPLVDVLNEWEHQMTRLILGVGGNLTEPIRVGAKMVTILVGSLNACWHCNATEMLGNVSASEPNAFSRSLNETFLKLYSTPIMTQFTFPKPQKNQKTTYNDSITVPSPLYISLLELPSGLLSQMTLPRESSTYCKTISAILQFCKCSYSNKTKTLVYETAQTYNRIFHDLASYWNTRSQQDGREKEFRIVVNNAFSSTSFLRQDGMNTSDKNQQKAAMQWLSSIDCFHPNQCMQGLMAVILWNNLFEDLESRPFDAIRNVSTLIESVQQDVQTVCPHRRIRLRT